jgi:hypothetical protein
LIQTTISSEIVFAAKFKKKKKEKSVATVNENSFLFEQSQKDEEGTFLAF